MQLRAGTIGETVVLVGGRKSSFIKMGKLRTSFEIQGEKIYFFSFTERLIQAKHQNETDCCYVSHLIG